jgi:hypothetical protein
MGRSDSLPLVSPHFVAFVWRYHRFVLCSSPPARDGAADQPGVGKPEPRPAVTTEMAGSLRFPSDPHAPAPCSRTPVGPMHARPSRRLGTAPACVYNGGSRNEYFEAQSHGIGTRCLRFAVKVAFPHARLASGCWPSFAGRDSFNPQGCDERFLCSSHFLPSRAYLTLRHPLFAVKHARDRRVASHRRERLGINRTMGSATSRLSFGACAAAIQPTRAFDRILRPDPTVATTFLLESHKREGGGGQGTSGGALGSLSWEPSPAESAGDQSVVPDRPFSRLADCSLHGCYGITGNLFSLQESLEGAQKIWKRWLSRRRRAGTLTWKAFLLLERPYGLPRARVVHSLLGSAAKS